MSRPYFIITSGVAGSGKTNLPEYTKQYLKKQPIASKLKLEEKPVFIYIDDLVETNQGYKNAVKDIIIQREMIKKNELDDTKNVVDEASLIKQNVLTNFEKAYYKARKTPKNGRNLNTINDQNIKDAIQNGRNIVFEFTGKYIPKWLLSAEYFQKTSYYIIFAYSLVRKDALIERNKKRAIQTISNFYKAAKGENLTGNNIHAPRLPDINDKTMTLWIEMLNTTLNHLYRSCFIEKSNEICGDVPIDRLLVFENNSKKMVKYYPEPIFDRENEPIFDRENGKDQERFSLITQIVSMTKLKSIIDSESSIKSQSSNKSQSSVGTRKRYNRLINPVRKSIRKRAISSFRSIKSSRI
jgi:hypothetical protein